MLPTKSTAPYVVDDYDYDYDDDYLDYDEVYISSNKGGSGGGRGNKTGSKEGLNVYSSKHTRLQAERKTMPKTSKRKK